MGAELLAQTAFVEAKETLTQVLLSPLGKMWKAVAKNCFPMMLKVFVDLRFAPERAC